MSLLYSRVFHDKPRTGFVLLGIYLQIEEFQSILLKSGKVPPRERPWQFNRLFVIFAAARYDEQSAGRRDKFCDRIDNLRPHLERQWLDRIYLEDKLKSPDP